MQQVQTQTTELTQPNAPPANMIPDQYNKYKYKPSAEIGTELSKLPTAEMLDIRAVIRGDEDTEREENVPKYKAVHVTHYNGKTDYVAVPTAKYNLVQHRDAFQPILDGLNFAGIQDYRYILNSTARKAELQIYASGEGYDTVSLGFSVKNTFDGSGAIRYGFRVSQQSTFVEVVGYRQVCSNGMKIRVPLENAEIVREELRMKIKELMSQHASIAHTRGANKRIEAMQYVVEAVSLLRGPVEEMIKRAERWTWKDSEELEELIKLHVGRRYRARVLEQLGFESQNLWGLYNAMTFTASHDRDLKDSARERLIEKAADMLVVEVSR